MKNNKNIGRRVGNIASDEAKWRVSEAKVVVPALDITNFTIKLCLMQGGPLSRPCPFTLPSIDGLRDLGLLEQKGRSNATYYLPTRKLLADHTFSNLQSSNLPSSGQNLPSSSPNLASSNFSLSSTANIVSSNSPLHIPEDLKLKIENLRKRSDIEEVKSIIKNLCSLHPFRIQELSQIIKRNPKYIKIVYIKGMLESGVLEYLFPHQPNHPQQAYRTEK